MRVFLFVAFLFVFFSGPVWAEEEQCTLKNTQFCGVWDGTGKGGGDLTVLGHKMFYENATEDDCIILDEKTKSDYLYTVLKCDVYFRDGSKSSRPRFYRLTVYKNHIHRLKKSYERLYIHSAEHLPCLFTVWKHEKIQDAYEFYQCYPGSTVSYSREIPYEGPDKED